ncbi:helix-turn-helix domain-containing protein [Actinomadura sp. DSM 109109]|nr:helix-turn-helix domain-containing protein [Actinomadura lepetitiana]
MTLQTSAPRAAHRSEHRTALEMRDDLGKQLRLLRRRANLTGSRLGELLNCHFSKISRIENGLTIPEAEMVRAWCHATGAGDEADDLAAMAENVDVAYRAYRNVQRAGGLKRLQEEGIVELFESTRRWQAYEPRVLPGLLQTVAYASAILEVTRQRLDQPDDVGPAAQARFALRRALDGPATFAYLIEEHVLREPIAAPDVMREQAEQLIADSHRPNISIGIVPMGRLRARHATENFTIFDEEMVRVQLLPGLFTATAPSDVAEYRKAFELLSTMAVYGDEARDLIRDAMG